MKAVFSDDGKYRYSLSDTVNSYAAREWPLSITWIMLNPSIAGGKVEDVNITDPTNTRVRNFTELWGYSDYTIINLFALVSTDPDKLQFEVDPTGPDNWRHCKNAIRHAQTVVCAWGSHKRSIDRGRAMKCNVRELGRVPMCLGTTLHGSPRHPLYMPKAAVLREYL